MNKAFKAIWSDVRLVFDLCSDIVVDDDFFAAVRHPDSENDLGMVAGSRFCLELFQTGHVCFSFHGSYHTMPLPPQGWQG